MVGVTCPYTSAVLEPNLGFTSTRASPPAGTDSSRSPRPVATAPPPWRKKGTSMPRPTAVSSRRRRGHRRPHKRFNPNRTAAASADPPPRPAATGIRLSSPTRTPRSMPAASRRASAARSARFVASLGTGPFVHPELDGVGVLKGQSVGQVDGLHHRRDFMISVVTLAQDLENQVDLGRSAEYEPATASRPLRQGSRAYHAPREAST